jgi:hypothetical protein
MDSSEPWRLDPSGDEQLRLAKQVRKKTLRDGLAKLHEVADQHFGMPASELRFAGQLESPLYVPARAANS